MHHFLTRNVASCEGAYSACPKYMYMNANACTYVRRTPARRQVASKHALAYEGRRTGRPDAQDSCIPFPTAMQQVKTKYELSKFDGILSEHQFFVLAGPRISTGVPATRPMRHLDVKKPTQASIGASKSQRKKIRIAVPCQHLDELLCVVQCAVEPVDKVESRRLTPMPSSSNASRAHLLPQTLHRIVSWSGVARYTATGGLSLLRATLPRPPAARMWKRGEGNRTRKIFISKHRLMLVKVQCDLQHQLKTKFNVPGDRHCRSQAWARAGGVSLD